MQSQGDVFDLGHHLIQSGQLETGHSRLVDPVLISNGGLKKAGTYISHPMTGGNMYDAFRGENIKFQGADQREIWTGSTHAWARIPGAMRWASFGTPRTGGTYLVDSGPVERSVAAVRVWTSPGSSLPVQMNSPRDRVVRFQTQFWFSGRRIHDDDGKQKPFCKTIPEH